MHDEQCGACLCADPGILVIVQGAQIVQQVPADRQRRGGDIRPPSVEGKQRRKDLSSIPGRQVAPNGWKELEKRPQTAKFHFGRYGWAVGPSAFRANIDDIGSLSNKIARLLKGPLVVNPPVPAERVIVDIDDTHDERTARKSDATITSEQFHLVLGGILFQAGWLLQQS
jgi:hypothetical protein